LKLLVLQGSSWRPNLFTFQFFYTMDIVKVRTEIAKAGQVKYEWNEKEGCLEVDRVYSSAVRQPTNYGEILDTLAEDGDKADILIFSDVSFLPGVLIDCRIIGCLITEDEKGKDNKFLSVPVKDATCDNIQDLEDLGQGKLNLTKHFFETYKALEPGKWVKVGDFLNKKEALKLLNNVRIERTEANNLEPNEFDP